MHAGRREVEGKAKGGKVHHEGHGHSHHQHHDDHDGHVAHVHLHEKGGKVKKAKGGVIPMPVPTLKGSPIARVTERGHTKKEVTKKRGGKIDGAEAMHHVGKKARGGRMTPGEPLSGADAEAMPYMAEHRAEAKLGAKIPQKIEAGGDDVLGAYGKGRKGFGGKISKGTGPL